MLGVVIWRDDPQRARSIGLLHGKRVTTAKLAKASDATPTRLHHTTRARARHGWTHPPVHRVLASRLAAFASCATSVGLPKRSERLTAATHIREVREWNCSRVTVGG